MTAAATCWWGTPTSRRHHLWPPSPPPQRPCHRCRSLPMPTETGSGDDGVPSPASAVALRATRKAGTVGQYPWRSPRCPLPIQAPGTPTHRQAPLPSPPPPPPTAPRWSPPPRLPHPPVPPPRRQVVSPSPPLPTATKTVTTARGVPLPPPSSRSLPSPPPPTPRVAMASAALPPLRRMHPRWLRWRPRWRPPLASSRQLPPWRRRQWQPPRPVAGPACRTPPRHPDRGPTGLTAASRTAAAAASRAAMASPTPCPPPHLPRPPSQPLFPRPPRLPLRYG